MLPGCTGGDPSTEASAPAPTSPADALQLVAIGDSIPYNSPDDCPGCTGFVDSYAEEVATATGRTVDVANLSEHTGLTLPGLLDAFDDLSPALEAADVIVVGIAHNSTELASDQPCDTPLGENDLPVWTAITQECADRSAEEYRPQYESLFSQIAALRAGQPTLLRTINRYNDWIGWTDGNLGPEEEQKTAMVIAAWNAMLCDAAERNGFACADISGAFNGPDGLSASGDLLADDYTHPSDLGNAAITEVLTGLGFEPLA
ncbi:MAG TPA: SGNH/GDSL hydrolase family protein [Blastococcus sp.]|nr:SGNH/GDSL hydrolase family protein [Blastococcus sp.]